MWGQSRAGLESKESQLQIWFGFESLLSLQVAHLEGASSPTLEVLVLCWIVYIRQNH